MVAIDPWTGEVLTLVSAPTFDPNLFAVGMSSAQFGALQCAGTTASSLTAAT